MSYSSSIPPNINPIHSNPSVHSSYFKNHGVVSRVFDGGKAAPNITPNEAIMRTLESCPEFDTKDIKDLRVNGKFEQRDGSFGGAEAVADVHVSSSGVPFFKFNLVWTVAAKDGNEASVHATVQQEIYTSITIPSDKSSKEFEEAKQRAFELAKSFEFIQRIAISTNHNTRLREDGEDVAKNAIKQKTILCFSRAVTENQEREVRSLKLSDKDIIELHFLNAPAKSVRSVAGPVLSRLDKMQSVRVFLRSELKSTEEKGSSSPSLSATSRTQSTSSSSRESPVDTPRARSISDGTEQSEIDIYETIKRKKKALDQLRERKSDLENSGENESEIDSIQNEINSYENELSDLNQRLLSDSQKILEEIDALLYAIPLEEMIQRAINKKAVVPEQQVKQVNQIIEQLKLEKERAKYDFVGSSSNSEWSNLDKVRELYVQYENLLQKYQGLEMEEQGAGVFVRDDEEIKIEKTKTEEKKEEVYKRLLDVSPELQQLTSLNNQLSPILEFLQKETILTDGHKDDFDSYKSLQKNYMGRLKWILTI